MFMLAGGRLEVGWVVTVLTVLLTIICYVVISLHGRPRCVLCFPSGLCLASHFECQLFIIYII